MKEERHIRQNLRRSSLRLRSLNHEPKLPSLIEVPIPVLEIVGHPAIPPAMITAERDHKQLDKESPIGCFTLDHAARVCEVNDDGAKLVGFAEGWLIGKSFLVFIARHHVQTFVTSLRESIRAHEPRTFEVDLFVCARIVPVRISITAWGEGRSVHHRLALVDLTEQTRAERLLQESLSEWYSLVHHAPDTIMTIEAGGRICFVNRPTWGYPVTALVGTNLLDHVPESSHSKILRCFEQSFGRNKKSMCEVSGVNSDWDKWFSLSFGSPRTAFGQLTTTTTIREISASKRTEQALRTSGDQMRDFAARLEAVREEERARVAREIHDELGQSLTALKLDLSWVESKSEATPEIRKRMRDMIVHIDNTIDCVRRISSDLRPSILDDLGLMPAIEWQAGEFRKRTGIRTEVVSNAEGLNLSADGSVAVFRVVQEALTNVMRHARASRVRIKVDLSKQALKISVADNGRGMTRSEETDLKSLGIMGMKERIARLGGEVNFVSGPGKGTRLDIVIPSQHD